MTGDPGCDLHPAELDFFRIVHSCEKADRHNYWLGPEGATGMESHFVLDLGCRFLVKTAEFKNSYNMDNDKRLQS